MRGSAYSSLDGGVDCGRKEATSSLLLGQEQKEADHSPVPLGKKSGLSLVASAPDLVALWTSHILRTSTLFASVYLCAFTPFRFLEGT